MMRGIREDEARIIARIERENKRGRNMNKRIDKREEVRMNRDLTRG